MAKSVHDDVLDAALKVVKDGGAAVSTGATRICVCNAQPTTYAEATSTYKLAIKTITSTDFTGPANGDASGRKLTSNQHSNITVDSSGDATHIALCDSVTSKLLYVTTCTTQALTSGNTVTIPAWDIEIADPS